MKRILILFSTLLLAMSTLAQTNLSVKEVGVTTDGRNRFGLLYRFGTESALWRLNLISVSNYNRESLQPGFNSEEHSRGYGFEFGKEFRKAITPNFAFRYGADLKIIYSNITSDNVISVIADNIIIKHNTSERYIPGLQLVLGFSYTLNRVVIGAELHPFLNYIIIESDSQSNYDTDILAKFHGLDFDWDSRNVELSVVYRL